MPKSCLDTDLKYIKGVGPKRAVLLSSLGLKTARDLIGYLPSRWKDRRDLNEPLPDYVEKETVFKGKVISSCQVYTSSPVFVFKVLIKTDKGEIEGIFFRKKNGRFNPLLALKKDFTAQREFWFIGDLESDLLKPRIRVSEYYPTDKENVFLHAGSIIPVYPSTSNLSQRFLRELVFETINNYLPLESDFLPKEILIKRGFLPINESIKNIHFPPSLSALKKAREKAVYEEFLLMLCAWGIKKAQTKATNKNRNYEIRKTLLSPFKSRLGFELTSSQKKAINEIFSDMRKSFPMSRLLQGDVGCGKTVVALSAALLACENGYQTAFMAPTEILAKQHYETISRILSGLQVKIALLTSSIKSSQRELIKKQVRNKEIDILIGTHSLIESEISFKSLGLVVIDEQHKFGVRQRAALREKGCNADMLIMTATPIPRTMALSLYGDLDISTINEMPPGRKPVKTYTASRKEAFEILEKEIKAGGQAYVVHPAIEESAQEIRSVKKEFEFFSKAYPQIKAGIIYGTMKHSEKEEVMRKFAQKEIKVLFATQVVEVGIDIKGATMMIIQNAERFGLASLHQLRGRVGRGEKESICIAVSEDPSFLACERLKIFCRFSDGFSLSQQDAILRGHGEIFGVKQHGDIGFTIANIYSDREILMKAYEDKQELMQKDPLLKNPKNALLRKKVIEIYAEKLKLIEAG